MEWKGWNKREEDGKEKKVKEKIRKKEEMQEVR